MPSLKSAEFAGFWWRFAALLLDGILLTILFMPLFFILAYSGFVAGMMAWVFILMIFSVWYEVYFIGKYGATYGKKWLGVKVVDKETRQVIGYPRAFLRWVGRLVVGFTLYIGYLIIPFTQNKQGLHDIIATTIVVKGKTDFEDKYY